MSFRHFSRGFGYWAENAPVPLPTRRGICRGAETFAATYARESSRASHVRLLGRIWIASVRDRRSRAPALHDTSASRPFACPERHPDGCLRDAERVDALVEAQRRSLARHRPRGAVDWRRATDRDVRAPSELARGRCCLRALVPAGRDACRLRRTRTPGLAPPGPLGAEPASPLDRPELHRGRSRRRAHSRRFFVLERPAFGPIPRGPRRGIRPWTARSHGRGRKLPFQARRGGVPG